MQVYRLAATYYRSSKTTTETREDRCRTKPTMETNKTCRQTVKKWAEFWNLATTMSKEKEAKLKPLKEAEARKAIIQWMRLYYKRWDSILDFQNFKFAPIPEGALDRVGEWGMTDDGDCCYEATWSYGRHGNPLYDGWVLEHSIPVTQRDKRFETYPDPPILQILRIIRTKGKSSWAGLTLSDGDYVVLGMLRLNRRLKNVVRKLRTFTIVRLHEYHIEYAPAPIVYIKSLEIWNEVITTKIRSPKDISDYTINDTSQVTGNTLILK